LVPAGSGLKSDVEKQAIAILINALIRECCPGESGELVIFTGSDPVRGPAGEICGQDPLSVKLLDGRSVDISSFRNVPDDRKQPLAKALLARLHADADDYGNVVPLDALLRLCCATIKLAPISKQIIYHIGSLVDSALVAASAAEDQTGNLSNHMVRHSAAGGGADGLRMICEYWQGVSQVAGGHVPMHISTAVDKSRVHSMGLFNGLVQWSLLLVGHASGIRKCINGWGPTIIEEIRV
jgi:hypothetical protein